MAGLTPEQIATRREMERLVHEIAEINDTLHSRIRKFDEPSVVQLLKLYKNTLGVFARDLGIILLKDARVN